MLSAGENRVHPKTASYEITLHCHWQWTRYVTRRVPLRLAFVHSNCLPFSFFPSCTLTTSRNKAARALVPSENQSRNSSTNKKLKYHPFVDPSGNNKSLRVWNQPPKPTNRDRWMSLLENGDRAKKYAVPASAKSRLRHPLPCE